MKKISTRLVAIALMAVLTTAFVSPAMANDEKNTIPVELKFVGNLKEQPLFHLVFNNTEESQFTITVRDSYGNVYYRETVKGSQFTKKFLLNIDDLDEGKVKFEISSKSYEKPVVFEINNSTKYVESYSVNKIK
jgi:hypothetical protein